MIGAETANDILWLVVRRVRDSDWVGEGMELSENVELKYEGAVGEACEEESTLAGADRESEDATDISLIRSNNCDDEDMGDAEEITMRCVSQALCEKVKVVYEICSVELRIPSGRP